MSKPAQQGPAGRQPSNISALSAKRPAQEVKELILDFNRLSKAHEDLYSRTRHETDLVNQSVIAARNADSERDAADRDHKTAQAEEPERRAPRPRQWLFAAAALCLDAAACYFAAEALGGSQPETIAWAALFLAVLGSGELMLDHFSDRHRVVWRWVAVVLGVFIMLLGLLRYSFLATVGAEGLLAALAGASLFSLATAGFVIIGYRALRAAESGKTWRARRLLRSRERAAAAAHGKLARQIAHRDGLASAYLSRIRLRLIEVGTVTPLRQMEQAVRTHLLGGDLS